MTGQELQGPLQITLANLDGATATVAGQKPGAAGQVLRAASKPPGADLRPFCVSNDRLRERTSKAA